MTINKTILIALIVLIPAGFYFYQAATTPDALLRKGLENGNQELVTESIKRGARLYEYNPRSILRKESAAILSQVAYEGDINKMKLLLQGGADVNRADFYGLSAVHYAAERNHEAMVRFLLEKGANANAPVPQNIEKAHHAFYGVQPIAGTTPLMLAAASNADLSVRTLLERGANARLKNNHGETALQIAQRISSQRNVPSFHVAKVIALLKYGPSALNSSS